MTETISLDAKLDLPAASKLMTALTAQEADELVLDFENVTHLGALCVQVLISAAKTANSGSGSISFTNVSDRVIDQLRVMGLTPESIAKGTT